MRVLLMDRLIDTLTISSPTREGQILQDIATEKRRVNWLMTDAVHAAKHVGTLLSVLK